MSIDLQGSRFYMQQLKGRSSRKEPARLKKDIVADIQTVLEIQLTSLMKVTNLDLEVLYGSIKIYKR